jgi:glucose 1-dehydrogenase
MRAGARQLPPAAVLAHAGEVVALVPDIELECTGVPAVILDVLRRNKPAGIVCLAGVSSGGHELPANEGSAPSTLTGVTKATALALARDDPGWLARLISRRVPLERWTEALSRRPDDVRVVLDLTS